VFDEVFVENMTFPFGDFNLDVPRIKVRGVLDGNVCAAALSHAGPTERPEEWIQGAGSM
jgi:hypothetical protein